MIKAEIFDQPLENGNVLIQEKVVECEKLYAEHKLPCTFKMTKSAPDGLQNFLVQILVYN